MNGIGKKTIEAFYRGEEKASRIVFCRYRKLVYFALSTVLKEKSDMDDAYQEVFFRLFKNKPEFDEEGHSLPSYLVKAARTIAIDMARRASLICLVDIEEQTGDQSQSVGYIVSKHLSPPLTKLEGEIVAYKAAFELSFSDVSEIIGIPETTVRRIYKKSMERIKKEYKHDR